MDSESRSSDPVRLVERALKEHLNGDEDTASEALQSILSDELRRERAARAVDIPTLPRPSDLIPEIERASRYTSHAVRLDVFRQDHFVCRYCSRGLVFTPVLRCLSLLYECFPFDSHWNDQIGHPFYYNHSTSIEHRFPISRRGTSERSNLITTCFLCNYLKGDALAEEIGWQELPRSLDTSWDGLISTYETLYSTVPSEKMTRIESAYHRPWLQAVRKA